MAKARNLVLGVGCLLVVLAGVIAVLIAYGMSSPALPGEIVLAVKLSGPIPSSRRTIPLPASAAASR